MRSLRLALAVVAVPLLLWAVLPLVSGAQRDRAGRLRERIQDKREDVQRTKRQERVLAGDVAAWTRRINRLQGDITTLQSRQIRLQTDLEAKRAELARIQERLRAERLRLTRLRRRLVEARAVLTARLLELYKADEPDIVTVVLSADGFAELIERTAFLERVSDQDSRIIDRVRAARAEAVRTEDRLDRLERRQTRVAAAIESRRDAVAAVKGRLVDRRAAYQDARGRKSQALASTRADRQDLEGDLAALEAEQGRVMAALRRAAARAAQQQGSAPSVAGPPRPGSGGLIWPVNGPLVSPFGQRWGRLHAGVDIAAPAGTPIRAAASGTVVLLGSTGGYGNYTCIQHEGGLSTCYAHQSSYATSNGASVSQGDVIGSVGCTGHCFGDHLHFETRINGSPVDPSGYLSRSRR
jgi:murein DD-endopeptidase MepM/ murein hydrolase activator NlpD